MLCVLPLEEKIKKGIVKIATQSNTTLVAFISRNYKSMVYPYFCFPNFVQQHLVGHVEQYPKVELQGIPEKAVVSVPVPQYTKAHLQGGLWIHSQHLSHLNFPLDFS